MIQEKADDSELQIWRNIGHVHGQTRNATKTVTATVTYI